MICDWLKVTRSPKHNENQKATLGNSERPKGYY